VNPDDVTHHAYFADWDAAYVLGSLSAVDRGQFESHLAECERCRDAVAELTGMPGLLARVSPEQAHSLLAPADPVAEPEGEQLPRTGPRRDLVELVRAEDARRRRSRRTRVVAWLAAAAVLVAIAVVVPATVWRSDQPNQTLVLDRAAASTPVSATIGLTSVGWGTKIDVECSYQSRAPDVDPEREWSFGLWVTTEDGTSQEVSSWKARNGWTVELQAATALPRDAIRTVEIRSRDTGKVLLSKSTG